MKFVIYEILSVRSFKREEIQVFKVEAYEIGELKILRVRNFKRLKLGSNESQSS